MEDPASDTDLCRVRAVREQEVDHRRAALLGGTAQRAHASVQAFGAVGEEQTQRVDLCARDGMLDRSDVEHIDRRIRLLSEVRLG